MESLKITHIGPEIFFAEIMQDPIWYSSNWCFIDFGVIVSHLVTGVGESRLGGDVMYRTSYNTNSSETPYGIGSVLTKSFALTTAAQAKLKVDTVAHSHQIEQAEQRDFHQLLCSPHPLNSSYN